MLKQKKAFKSTIVNRALPFLHGGSLKITLTVPLIPFGQSENSSFLLFKDYHDRFKLKFSVVDIKLRHCKLKSFDLEKLFFHSYKTFICCAIMY